MDAKFIIQFLLGSELYTLNFFSSALPSFRPLLPFPSPMFLSKTSIALKSAAISATRVCNCTCRYLYMSVILLNVLTFCLCDYFNSYSSMLLVLSPPPPLALLKHSALKRTTRYNNASMLLFTTIAAVRFEKHDC
jgi:hypothetical protein